MVKTILVHHGFRALDAGANSVRLEGLTGASTASYHASGPPTGGRSEAAALEEGIWRQLRPRGQGAD